LRRALEGGKVSFETTSLIIVYSLAKALKISPLEIYKMPAKLVIDLLQVHKLMKEKESEEIDKAMKKSKR
jgi:hypothetical protein|tara:strand:- start:71 stop:280 length:210 start_codon:yes stop_codon:yes gene_type:complete